MELTFAFGGSSAGHCKTEPTAAARDEKDRGDHRMGSES
jgi:hypothetical protein